MDNHCCLGLFIAWNNPGILLCYKWLQQREVFTVYIQIPHSSVIMTELMLRGSGFNASYN